MPETAATSPDLAGRIPVDGAILDVLDQSRPALEETGARVNDDCINLDGADEVFNVLRAWQFAVNYEATIRAHPTAVKETVRWDVARGARLTGADLASAEQRRTRLHLDVVDFFDRHDVLVTTTTQVLPFGVDIEYPTEIAGVRMSTYVEWMRSCTLISATGCPALSLPAGFSADRLPVGVQIVRRPGADLRVLATARSLERVTGYGRCRAPL